MPAASVSPSARCLHQQPADIGEMLPALELRRPADALEDRRLGQRVQGQVQQPREGGGGAAQPEGEGGDAGLLDGGEGEEPLHVAPRPQAERRQQHGWPGPSAMIGGPGAIAPGVGVQQAAQPQDDEQRHVQDRAGQHGGDRRRPLGVRVRHPGVQRRQPGLGAVAEQQEHEGEVQHGGAGMRAPPRAAGSSSSPAGRSRAPAPRPDTAAWCRRTPCEMPTPQSRNMLPRRLDRLGGARQPDHEHRGDRGGLDRAPGGRHVVGQQRQQHEAQIGLEQRVIGAQPRRHRAGRPLPPTAI